MGIGNRAAREVTPLPVSPPDIPAFEPAAIEGQASAKRVGARIAQTVLTYRRGSTPEEIAKSVTRSPGPVGDVAKALRPAFRHASRSWARVVYPQLSGLTVTTAGTMVVVKQTIEAADARRRQWTRVVDVRLRLSGGRWGLDRLATVGGRALSRPRLLPPAAESVLENPKIQLSDSARWDIYRGRVDMALLSALNDAAERHRLAISVFASGHPRNVWATGRESAHTQGLAADIYEVDGRLVAAQRDAGSAAFDLTGELLAGGAVQIGSPWVFAPGGSRSFSDATHQDHIHVQQRPSG